MNIISNFLPQDRIISDKEVGEAWDRLADSWHSGYQELGDVNRKYIIDPAIFKILGEVKGKRILDAGCGNGYLCRLLARKGGVMVGVDVSKRFIEIAKEIESRKPMNIKYHVESLCNLSIFADETFDAVVSNIVLSDLQNLDKAMREIHRILQPEGQFVFSIMHPCFSSPPVHGWVRKPIDSARREDWLCWIVDHYFDRGIEEWAFSGSPSVSGFHRPLSDYMRVLVTSGFIIEDFEEPVPIAKDIEEHYRELNDGDRIPWFLVIGATKQSSTQRIRIVDRFL